MARKKKVRTGLSTWAKIKQIFWRMLATFAANGLATIGAGRIITGLVNVGKEVESLQVRFKFLFGSPNATYSPYPVTKNNNIKIITTICPSGGSPA
jgi:hypothetical protein